MPDQFTVPQFIDAEDQIFGPLTARQFIIMMVVLLVDFAFFKLLSFAVFLTLGIPLFILGIVFAFVKINGMPFHYFVLNIIQTFKKPRLRVWDKTYTTAQLKEFMREEPKPAPPAPQRKQAPVGSRLQELTLVVDTGGVYQPEEE